MHRPHVTVALLLAFAAGCGARVTEPLPEIGATEFAPLPQYALWWQMAESCSGLTRNMAEIRWLTDPSSARRTVEGSADTVVGEWYSGTSSIVLTREYLNDPGVVRHEMLHALLRNAGHPAATFRDACGGYVVCGGSCAGAVGATPASTVTARKVEVDSLAVTQSIRSGLGWFALVVEARNARSYPVWVRLQPFPGRTDVAATFGYASGQNSHQNEITGDSMSFAPGETKRFVFDLMADQYVVDNGSRKIRGFFNAVKLPELIVP